MAIIRVEKQKNYTVMSNHHLQDGNLSLKAKGLLSMMLSLPEDWVYSVEGLVSLCKEGRDAVRSALAELEDPEEFIDAFLARKVQDPGDRKQIKKASDALVRRGFSWPEVKAGLNRLGSEIED